jgi:DNA repair protein RecO (recombination protein O)
MPSFRDDAIVLRTHLLGEADRIVTVLTRRHGKVRAVAKGVRKTTSRFGSRVEPFMFIDLQWASGKSLDIVQQVEILGAYGGPISTDYAKFAAASSMVETCDRLTEHDSSPTQFSLLVAALRSLAGGEHDPSLTLDSYLLRSLALAGWAVQLTHCAQTGVEGPHQAFVVAMGGMVSDPVAPPGSPRIDREVLALLLALAEGDWASAEASTDRARKQTSTLISAFTQYHVERAVKSLTAMDRERKNTAHGPREQAS